MIRALRTYLAKRRLARMVKQNASSFETERYRRNRAAQIKRRVRA